MSQGMSRGMSQDKQLPAHPSLPTLYWANGSIPSWQVMLALYELRRPFYGHRLKLMSVRETKKEPFLALNPRGEVPVWREPSGVVICESKAILFHLILSPSLHENGGERGGERERGGESLLSADPALRALTLQRFFEVDELRAAYRPLERLFLGVNQLDEHERAHVKRALSEHLPSALGRWERHLERDAHAGLFIYDQLTLADVALYPTLAYQVRRGLSLDAYPHLNAYHQRLSALPQVSLARPIGWDQPAKRDLFKLAATLNV